MRRFLLVFAAASLMACAKDVDLYAPRPIITLLVTNSTCLTGPCDSVRVLAFPSEQPRTPGGYWSLKLGVMNTPQKCFALPPAAKFYVIAEPAESSRDTTTFTWTSFAPVSLGALAPGSGVLQAIPTTVAFTPANAEGWEITLPKDSAAAPSATCTP